MITVPSKVHFSKGAILAIPGLALCLLVPALAGWYTDHEARAAWEKRELASWDSVVSAHGVKDRFAALSDFIDDHIGFALLLNRAYREFVFNVFGDSPIANVSVGDDGFVFLNSHRPERPFAALQKACQPGDALLDDARRQFDVIADFALQRGVRTTLAIVPSKVMLYADRLPDTVPRHLRQACQTVPVPSRLAGRLRAVAPQLGFDVFFPFEEMYARRDEAAFYPPGNFHPDSRLNHVFAAQLLERLGIDINPRYDVASSLDRVTADLGMLGFRRTVDAWTYDYSEFEVRRHKRQAAWVRDAYRSVRDWNLYLTRKPLSPRHALLLSNSFGALLADDLAPGFASLQHINLNQLKQEEAAAFLATALDDPQVTDLLLLVHDAALPYVPVERMAESLEAGAVQ